MTSTPKLLITGASGQFGQRVTHHLLETLRVPAASLTLLTRDPSRLAAAAARGVEVRTGDLDAPDTLSAPFQGADRVLLISTDAIGRRVQQHRAAIEAAVEGSARHLVYTSMPDPFASKVSFAPEHAATETAVMESGLPGWTVLRNHWYFENLSMTLPALRASGKWFTAAGDGRVADAARDDLALAAANALVRLDGRETYTLSGPEALSVGDLSSELERVLRTSIDVVPVTAEQLADGLVTQASMPRPVAEMFASFDQNTASGAVGTVTGDLERLIGRSPLRFGDWLEQNATALLDG
ncbi:MAG: NAD(P)H-binding protein [Myxococcota bacterium]